MAVFERKKKTVCILFADYGTTTAAVVAAASAVLYYKTVDPHSRINIGLNDRARGLTTKYPVSVMV